MSVTVDELQARLEEILGRTIARLERRPSPRRSTYRLEELDIELDDGAALELVLKDLSRQSLEGEMRRAKPAFLYDPLREVEAYRLLEPAGIGTARRYGAVVERERDRFWLFLERVPGVDLPQVGLEGWREAAQWLAGLHSSIDAAGVEHLLGYDRTFYELWLRRACDLEPELEPITARYGEVIDRLLALPVTFVHGEFYASNVLVERRPEGVRICPVDWEMAAVGPGLLDVAALTAGRWSDEARTELALTYRAALQATGAQEAFLEALDCCRLHVALQWLGWSREWSPPPEHAHDWLGEALRLAERLDLLR